MSEDIFVNIGKKPVNLYVSEMIRQLYMNIGKRVTIRAMGSEAITVAIHTVCILQSDKIINSDIKIEVGMEANRRGSSTATIAIQVKSVIEGDIHA